jgi:hypothetical protein
MVFEPDGELDRGRIASALLEYCKRDTLGMLEIRRALSWKAMTPEPAAP